MSALRAALLAALAALALNGCGRKDTPERPESAAPVEPTTEPRQEDDLLEEETPEPVTPGPDLEDETDDRLDG